MKNVKVEREATMYSNNLLLEENIIVKTRKKDIK